MSESKIVVRRAKLTDVPAIRGLINAARQGQPPLSQEQVQECVLQKGYRIAVSRQGAAVAGWQTENLVTLVDDFYVYPDKSLDELTAPLLEEVEKAAEELACEAIIFFLEQTAPEKIFAFLRDQGYRVQGMAGLHHYWQEVAQERLRDGSIMMVKQLADEIRLEPL